MELQSIKQLILDESKPIEDRLKAIVLLKESNLPDKAEFLESLMFNSNIQIRYYAKKVVSEKEPSITAPAKSSKPREQPVEQKVKEVREAVEAEEMKPESSFVERIPAMLANADNNKFLIISGGILCGIIGIIIIIVFMIIVFSSEKPDQVQISQTQYMPVVDDNLEKEKRNFETLIARIRNEIQRNFDEGNNSEAFNKCIQLFRLLENNVETLDYKSAVNVLDKMPWKFFGISGNKINNRALHSVFSLVYEVKSLIVKNKVNTRSIIEILSRDVRPFVFLSADTIQQMDANIASINSTYDQKLLSILTDAHKHNFLTAENSLTILRASPEEKQRISSILKNIEANSLFLPEAAVSVTTDKEFLKEISESLEEKDTLHFENLLEKKVGINNVSSSIKEIYYAFKNDLAKGRKILDFGIERTQQQNTKNSLALLLAKHYLHFNDRDKAMSLLYSLYYSDSNPDAKQVYFSEIRKVLARKASDSESK